MDSHPKTRQEKKGKGSFYGKSNKGIYSQRHIRVHEQLLLAHPTATPSTEAVARATPKKTKRKK